VLPEGLQAPGLVVIVDFLEELDLLEEVLLLLE
jgi:hypothetical protein